MGEEVIAKFSDSDALTSLARCQEYIEMMGGVRYYLNIVFTLQL